MKKLFKQKNKAFTRTPKFGVTPKGGGFTLVETLVAISIFTMSILGLITVLASGIADTNYAKRKIIATYLAQEGIEYVRNMRDTYVLYSANPTTGWTAFNNKLLSVSANCQGANGCYFDDRNVSFSDTTLPMTDLLFTACTSSTCANAPLLYNSTTGKYGYVSGSSSGFTRKIFFIYSSANEARFSSTVYWTQGSGSRSVVLSGSVYNWVE